MLKLFEKYGRSIAEYEGTAEITAVDTRYQTERAFTGYFEAQQSADGSLRMGFISTNRPTEPVTDFEFKSGVYEITEILARDTSGWDLTFEDTSSFPMSLLHYANDGPAPNPTIVEFGSRRLRARSRYSNPSGYESARFLVTNLLFGGNIPPGAPTACSKSDAFEVSISKLPDYELVSGRVGSGGTIEPTVEFHISDVHGRARPLTDFVEHMTDLVYLYRLTTGVSVDWCLAEGLSPGFRECEERIHQAGSTGPCSVNFTRLIPVLRVSAISEAFQKKDYRVFEGSTIREFIDFFVAACDGRAALELRGLLASTLIDSIVSKYVTQKRQARIIPTSQFDRLIRDEVVKQINDLSEPNINSDLKSQMRQKIPELNRATLTRNLRLLSDDLDLGLSVGQIEEIKNVRNHLVHAGTFPSPVEDSNWWNEYHLLIWAAFNMLCRLIGYEGRPWPRTVNSQ